VSEKVLEQGLKVIYIDKFGLITNAETRRMKAAAHEPT